MNGSKGSSIFCEYDFLEFDSDQERGLDSSDDEIDIILHGTPKQRRKLSRSLSEGSLEVLSSGDEFEKEMDMELEESMRKHQTQQSELAAASSFSGGNTTNGTSGSNEKGKKYYDDVYFDSDEEGEEEEQQNQKEGDKPLTAKQKKRKLVQSNEDLFYDPDIDDQNQKWVDKQRSRYYPTKPGSDTHPSSDKTTPSGGCQSKPNMAAAKSDAILNCPACMTTLCLDCQRHELYPTQYRAMFVLNCLIVRSEKLKFKPGQKKKRKWKRKSNKGGPNEDAGEASAADESGVEESYHPVRCAECNTEVAVYDCEEVYHFFNVITGIA